MNIDENDFTAVMNQVADAFNKDQHHRLLSWDHAWEHWKYYCSNDREADDSLAALHLAFYLASSGMYRGSSNLLYRDYKVLVPVVQFLKSQASMKPWEDCFFDTEVEVEELAGELCQLAAGLSTTLKQKLARPGKDRVNISDTLQSKILFNTLCCVPAFDSEVKAALNDILENYYPTCNCFSKNRLVQTINLARKNAGLIKTGQKLLNDQAKKRYPLTKVLDLYLWHHGFNLKK
jgi:hypothetical protein